MIPYLEAQQLQKQLQQARKRDELDDQLLLLEHPPVVTLGRPSSESYLKVDRQELAAQGIEIHESGRGGEVTYHGPGQLVAYPILKLDKAEQDLHLHLRRLEEVGILLCRHFQLQPQRVEGRTGVWLGQNKIAAIGVRASSWVTSHGIAFNLDGPLDGFELMIPCGLEDAGVTRLSDHVEAPPMKDFKILFQREFEKVFERCCYKDQACEST